MEAMAELVARLGAAERVQTGSWLLMLDLEQQWRNTCEMWRESKQLVADLSAELDRYVR